MTEEEGRLDYRMIQIGDDLIWRHFDTKQLEFMEDRINLILARDNICMGNI